MTPEVLVGLIGSVGFPIVAYFVQHYRYEKAMDRMTEAVNNNTKVLTEFILKNEKD